MADEKIDWKRITTPDGKATYLEADTSIGTFTVEYAPRLNWHIHVQLKNSKRPVLIHKNLPSEKWALGAVPKFIYTFKLKAKENGIAV